MNHINAQPPGTRRSRFRLKGLNAVGIFGLQAGEDLKKYIYKKIMETNQIFIALFIALINGIFAVRLGIALYR